MWRIGVGLLLVFGAFLGFVILRRATADVVVYVSLDEVYAAEIEREFERETGLRAEFVPDTEANKTVGHFNRLLTDRDRPKADVFWNNEAAHTVLLQQRGLLEPYRSPSAEDIPASMKDPDGYWTGFAARARVLIVNTRLLPDRSQWPSRLVHLVDPKWRARGLRTTMAKPLTGTTLTHAAALYVADAAGAEAFLFSVSRAAEARNLVLALGNAHVARLVSGQMPGETDFAFGLTDTDDANAFRLQGAPIEVVYPDQGEGEPGALVIPNTVALIRGGPNPENARRFIDFLLRPDVEARLAALPSAQIPVRPGVEAPPHVKRLGEFRAMEVDWGAVGRAMDERLPSLQERFAR